MEVLPIPPFFDPSMVGEVWRVPYQKRAQDAEEWAKSFHVKPASEDQFKISLLLVDVQNTFCIPEYELYVGGASGTGAVEDNQRLCEFIYRNLRVITQINPTMDTHQAAQIFHSVFLLDEKGNHPDPLTLISAEDIEKGTWKFNPKLAAGLQVNADDVNTYLRYYTRELKTGGKYDLTVWPYHAMLGGIGHALVSAVEEAIFFHTMARFSLPDFQIKGNHPLTENYSVLRPEVMTGPEKEKIADKNAGFIRRLIDFDALIIAGQAKSHCVVWTIDDLLDEILAMDAGLTGKIYLLEDCSSPVVIPGVIDYTEAADAAFKKFADAGMHLVRSVDPIRTWPGITI